jgi:hypothetical protein
VFDSRGNQPDGHKTATKQPFNNSYDNKLQNSLSTTATTTKISDSYDNKKKRHSHYKKTGVAQFDTRRFHSMTNRLHRLFNRYQYHRRSNRVAITTTTTTSRPAHHHIMKGERTGV